MASFVKYNCFVENLAEKVHNLGADTLKIALTNTAPDVAAHTVRADIGEIAAGNGYTSGGNAAAVTGSAQTGGVYKLTLGDPATWSASGGTIGPFRYAVLYNDTPTSPADPLIGYWDYGSSITLQVGETFTVDLDQTNGVLTIT
ncbi:MAG TPA: hypothetical protein VFW49_14820 [Fluviicoccus sp.]|nr:hypothetical protein [Fluviicoccus sp.]